MAQPVGCFGRLAFKSKGVDSLVGFWEIAGCLTEDEGRAFPEGYSSEAKAALEDVFGLKIVGGHVASAEEALQELGASHLSAGAPVVWTDGRQTCHGLPHCRQWIHVGRAGRRSERVVVRVVLSEYPARLGQR